MQLTLFRISEKGFHLRAISWRSVVSREDIDHTDRRGSISVSDLQPSKRPFIMRYDPEQLYTPV